MVVGVGAVALAVAGGAFFGRGPAPAPPATPTTAAAPARTVVAHISGAVRNPGLVLLGDPARVADAVGAAGGATIAADLGAINLAAPVRDGDHIVVPAIGESVDAGDGLVDLNRATAQDLAKLHGIGPVLAERIVAYRDEHGEFGTIEDLLDVPGIGEAKLALLRPGVSAP
jgi:competence protein ComEA